MTGGGGFLGSVIVRQLQERGDKVSTLARGPHPGLAARGVRHVRGDVADLDAVRRAAAGCDAVVHTAARAGIGGPVSAYRRTNVDGTRAVIRVCREQRVGRLVHTSTPSVVHAGTDIAGGTEDLPYPRRYAAAYPATKAEAERRVLAANGPDLVTVALRPHLVWGPGDTHLVPALLARARTGRLRLVGDGRALVDTTFVEDAARAHLDALDALAAPGAAAAGRPYFIAQGEPLPVAELVNGILAAAGLPPETRTVPFAVAWAAGAAAEVLWRVRGRDDDPPTTRFLARQLATAHWFDLTAARRDLGYRPRFTIAQGLVALRRSLTG